MTQSILLKIARDSIEEVILAKRSIDKKALLEEYPVLSDEVATFITITIDNKLRGCIGSLVAHKPLLEDIIYNAKAAAFHDPRFSPVTTSEYLHSAIEVSILTEPKELIYSSIDELKSLIRVGKDGITLIHGESKATFLPQVWEELPTFEEFFSHLLQKAGLSEELLDLHPIIYSYQVAKERDEPIIKGEKHESKKKLF